jgi:hypothetical protein
LSVVERFLGASVQARQFLKESLAIFERVGSTFGLGCALAAAAVQANVRGDPVAVGRLAGAAEKIYPAVIEALDPEEIADYKESTAAAKAALGQDVYDRAVAEGRAMTLAEAIACALL